MRILTLAAIVLVLGACSEPEVKVKIDQKSYFPLEKGRSWTYKVSQKKYYNLDTGKTKHDTINSTYTQVIRIDTVYKNSSGEDLYYFGIKNDSLGSWRVIDPWSAWIKGEIELHVREHNKIFVRLLFPFSETTTWNLNTYNTRSYLVSGNDICTIEYLTHDRSEILVREQDNQVPLADKRYSIYKAGVGLIERYSYLEEWRYNSKGNPYVYYKHEFKMELVK